MTVRTQSRLGGVGIALATAAIAAIVNGLLWPDFGNRYPLIGFYPAIVVTAVLGGAWPGIVCTVAASLIAAFVWLDHRVAGGASGAADAVALTVFVAIGAVISILSDASARRAARERLARQRAERAEREVADELADMRRLQQFTTTVFRDDDPAAILEDLLQTARELLDASAAHVHLHDESEDMLRLAVHSGLTATAADRLGTSGPDGATLDAFLLRRRIVIVGTEPGGVAGADLEASPMITADGRVLGVLTTYRSRSPVPERRRRFLDASVQQAAQAMERCRLLECERVARRDAEEASRQKDVFLSMVSHELRTPLNAVLGWTDMLRKGLLSGAAHERALRSIAENAERQLHLIGELLDLARITAGTLRIELADIAVRDIVRKAIEVVEPAAATKNLRVIVADADARCRADAGRLQQILWNLLTNAVKFTPAGGSIEVSVGRLGEAVQIRVRDTGAGIPASFLPHVFEPFRQADTSTTRSHSGLGLGLSIVKHLVEAHGGTIAADSRGEGYGACFTVTLPAPAEGAIAAAASPTRDKIVR